jgi:tRNA pseudouridine55 synthase
VTVRSLATRSRPIDGVLLVDKPAGITSHDVVAVTRRALGLRRIGHAGTLDPFATGLLVLLVGRATRLLPYIDGEPKEYEATVRFGAETDTDDVTGVVTRTAALPDWRDVARGISALTGEIEQMPPAFSAKRIAGRRSHDAARRGESLALAPARVTVHGWAVRQWRREQLEVVITCSGGTYVRALARDLGRLSGSAAHLTALRRLRSGAFTIRDAMPLGAVRGGAVAIRPPLEAVRSLPVERLDGGAVARVARGMAVRASVDGPRAALVDASGALIAVAERSADSWQPRVVLCD